MSWQNKVIWSEGLFLTPAHFQQHDRYTEQYVNQHSGAHSAYHWGFESLVIDQALLQSGKLAIQSAKGIMPDGTPFNIPENDPAPAPLELPEGAIDQIAYLCLPLTSTSQQVDDGLGEPGMQRYRAHQIEVNDTASLQPTPHQLQVGGLRFSLLLAKEQRSAYACLGLCHVSECSKDKQVSLEAGYLPPLLSTRNNTILQSLITELSGLLHHRGNALAARVSASGSGGAAEIADFLMLQIINRHIPLLQHMANLPQLHPEQLYRCLISLCGELSTFREPRLAAVPGEYRHDNLEDSFGALAKTLRDHLATVLDSRAVPIPIMEPRYGIYRALVNDSNLFSSASFILAVKADMNSEELRRSFPNQVKISSVEQIRELVMSGLAGIGLQPLPVAPRQIPYHAGYVYFELDKHSASWVNMQGSTGFAFHISGSFSGLELEFWAVQQG